MVYLSTKSETFYFYKLFMKFVGIWPSDRNRCGSAIFFWFLVSLQILNLSTLLYNRHGTCPTYVFGTNQFQSALWQIAAITLKLGFRLLRAQIISLIESTSEEWSSITDPEEREIMIQHNKYGSVMIAVEALFLCICPSIKMIVDLSYVNPENQGSTLQTCLFLDANSIGATINSTLAWVVIFSNNIMLWYTSAMFWSFAMQLSSQFKILKARFHALLLIDDVKESRKVFRRLVDRHNEIFTQCEVFESSFNVFISNALVIGQISVCIYVLMLLENLRPFNIVEASRTLLIGTVIMLMILIFHYASEYLADSCEDVAEEFTQCNWYDLPKEFRINYNIVVSRCRKPPVFTSMKVYILSLSNFKLIFQTLYSYISMLVALTNTTDLINLPK